MYVNNLLKYVTFTLKDFLKRIFAMKKRKIKILVVCILLIILIIFYQWYYSVAFFSSSPNSLILFDKESNVYTKIFKDLNSDINGNNISDNLFKAEYINKVISTQIPKGNIGYNEPDNAYVNDPFDIQVIISNSLSIDEIQSKIIYPGNFKADRLEISNQMKAVLNIKNYDGNELSYKENRESIQAFNSDGTIEWNWTIKSLVKRDMEIEIIIYRLTYDNGYIFPVICGDPYKTTIKINVKDGKSHYLKKIWYNFNQIIVTTIIIPLFIIISNFIIKKIKLKFKNKTKVKKLRMIKLRKRSKFKK